MHIKTKRWNDPVEPDDGTQILVCRYRPRGVRKADETWQEWWKDLGPTAELHAAFYGKHGPPVTWGEYRRRYLAEMRAQKERIAELARRVQGGEAMTLLCSSACVDPERCHRTMLARLITEAAETPKAQPRRKA
ncbi:DUF488 domain-containing protein [Sorangium sp. So ce854]|uniref:DUF488 domain-containing protein n=1 Tax=Sorangium sp. So ce854 TaxID=3133322 RepID=UPI003F5E2C7C